MSPNGTVQSQGNIIKFLFVNKEQMGNILIPVGLDKKEVSFNGTEGDI